MSEQAGVPVQFGIMSVSDITRDPTTGTTPSEQERIKATLAIAKHSEEVVSTSSRSVSTTILPSGRPARRRSSRRSRLRPSD